MSLRITTWTARYWKVNKQLAFDFGCGVGGAFVCAQLYNVNSVSRSSQQYAIKFDHQHCLCEKSVLGFFPFLSLLSIRLTITFAIAIFIISSFWFCSSYIFDIIAISSYEFSFCFWEFHFIHTRHSLLFLNLFFIICSPSSHCTLYWHMNENGWIQPK